MKLCDPKHTGPNYCENRFDLLGCAYNAPAAYVEGEFSSCEGELQDVVGVYTSAGRTLTYSQPSIVTGTLPYTPRIPASSNCVTYQSSDLYPGVATTSVASATTTGAAASATGTGVVTTSRSGSAAAAATGAPSTGAAGSVGASVLAVLGVAVGAWIMA